MADQLNLSILSPERRLLESVAVSSVTLPGSEGQIQVLPGHAPMVGTLETGTFSFQTLDGKTESGAISTGFFEVNGETISVMVETIELRKEIDLARSKAAQSKAEAALQSADLDEAKFRKYQLKLQRAIVRQQVASSAE